MPSRYTVPGGHEALMDFCQMTMEHDGRELQVPDVSIERMNQAGATLTGVCAQRAGCAPAALRTAGMRALRSPSDRTRAWPCHTVARSHTRRTRRHARLRGVSVQGGARDDRAHAAPPERAPRRVRRAAHRVRARAQTQLPNLGLAPTYCTSPAAPPRRQATAHTADNPLQSACKLVSTHQDSIRGAGSQV